MIVTSPIAAAIPERIASHRYARVGAVRLHVAEAGEGPPLVFLHGFPENWYSWRRQIRALSAQFHVVAPDLRGYGLSERPASGYDVNTLAADLLGLLDELGIHRADLIGHDWGALILWRFAFAHPGRCHRLAFLNTPHLLSYNFGPLSALRHPQFAYLPLFQMKHLPEWLIRSNPEGFLKGIYRIASHGRRLPLSRGELSYLSNLWSRPGASRAPLAYYHALAESRRQSRGDRGKTLDLPILFLSGQSDPFFPPRLIDPMRSQLSELTVHRIPHCGHWPQAEQPAEVNRALERFFAR